MSMTAHPGEQLVEFVDGRLDEGAASTIRGHLASCEACRAIHADLVAAQSAAVRLRADVEMPTDLLTSVTRALDAEAASTLAPAPAREPERSAPRLRWPLWTGVAAAAAVVLAFLVLGPRDVVLDLPAQAARDLEAVGSRTLPLDAQGNDVAALERYFATSPGPRVRVIDLAMMNIVLEGGLRHTLDGRQSALYSYRTPSGARLVCQMYEGRLADLPPPGEVRDQNGFRFQVYTRGVVTVVFWQEGELVCVLASALPADEVIALAVAKAMAPA